MGDPFKPLTDFGKNMEKGFGVFKEIGERMKRIKYGFDDIGNGIKNEFKGLGDGLNIGVTDIGRLLEYVFIFVGSYINCSVYFLTNLKSCLFYYIMDFFGQVCYLPFRLALWFFSVLNKVLGTNNKVLESMVDKFWIYVEVVDKIVYKYGNFHISHYPRDVRRRCYVCRRLKQRVIVRQGDKVNDDFSKDGAIAQEFAKGINQMKDGGKNIKSALTDPF
jgi:hypothetical protein